MKPKLTRPVMKRPILFPPKKKRIEVVIEKEELDTLNTKNAMYATGILIEKLSEAGIPMTRMFMPGLANYGKLTHYRRTQGKPHQHGAYVFIWESET